MQEVIPAMEADHELKVLTDLQAKQSPFTWPKVDNLDRGKFALVGTDASPGPGVTNKPVHSWETGGKSFLIPALEIPGFVVLLNGFDRLAFPNKRKEGRRAYNTTPSTTWEHLHRQNWHFDNDTFQVNQFGHPYEGATMYGLARSSGLNFWQSLIYSHAGSFLWEMAGETSRPSFNDLITTGNAGSLLGEALFRMAGLVIEDGSDRNHEIAAALISPPSGFNRIVFADRFKNIFPSHKPATLWQFMVGANVDVHSTGLTSTDSSHDANFIGDFSMAYGLPGKPGYTYRRPLDYFDFQMAMRARIKNPLEAITLRGLLMGADYQLGSDYRGIWGLYGSYDYISPQLYRVSSTAVSLGTTAQYWIAPGIALQDSVLGGVGFGAAGTDTDEIDGRGYHYATTPQGLLAFSLLFGDRTMLDVTGRGYYVSVSDLDQLVLRINTGITIRVIGNHAIGLRYIESVRNTYSSDQPTRHHSEGTISLVYTFLSDIHFGAVEWR